MRLRALGAAFASGAPLALPGHPSIAPWPIGPGARYVPAASAAAVAAGAPLGRLRCSRPGAVFAVHLEIFADRRALVIPAGIGIARPSTRVGATVVPGGCTYPLSTRTPAGIVEVARGIPLRLGDLFRVWGQALGPHRIASFRSAAPVRAYLDGRLVRGRAAAIVLTRHAELVLELGGYVPPHPTFLFAGADSP